MHVIYFLIEKKYTIAGMTIIRAELQTTDFLFLCRSSLLLSEICQSFPSLGQAIFRNLMLRLLQMAFLGVYISKIFWGGMPLAWTP
jgi:hypothetical protein